MFRKKKTAVVLGTRDVKAIKKIIARNRKVVKTLGKKKRKVPQIQIRYY